MKKNTIDITKMGHKTLDTPTLNVVLYQPEIPSNTGSIARMCGAAELRLHLIHPLGFKVDDKHLKRAGLDYWYEVDIHHHDSFKEFLNNEVRVETQIISFSRFADPVYTESEIVHGAYLLFGQETKGLPDEIRERFPCYRIPIWGRVRSLNLATTVGIVSYHYLNKLGCFG